MAFAFQIRHSASQDRLEKLIEQRLVPGADKEAIDAHIWDLFGENWVVMFTDLSGFSQEVAEFGIIHFLQIIHESHKLLVPCIDAYGGILLKIEADSMLVIFRNVQKALDCAVHMQRTVQEHNRHKIPIEQTGGATPWLELWGQAAACPQDTDAGRLSPPQACCSIVHSTLSHTFRGRP